MKNRLLPILLLLLPGAVLLGQNGLQSVTITGGTTCGCDGCFVVTVSNMQPPYIFQWSNGQQNSVNVNNTTICGFCPGTYTVTVTNGNTNPTTVTATGTIQFLSVPIDIISLNPAPCNTDSSAVGQDCEKVCAGATVTYGVSSNGGPLAGTFLSWQVSGASSFSVDPNTGATVTVTWGSAGPGSVRVFSDSQCAGEDYLCVTVLEPPTAAIGSLPAAPSGGNLQICKGQTVDFQNLSTGAADFYEWYFSDDLSSTTTADPQHTFVNVGTHTVTLVARSNCLCSDTTTFTVEVLDGDAPILDCVASICPGETVTYTSANACAPFAWTVSPNGAVLEGGTATSDSITVQWGDGPSGTISLNATACSGNTCPLAGVTNIPIISDNAEIRGEERVCPGSSEVYSIEAFGGTGFVWTLSGGGFIKDGQGTNRVNIDWQNAVSTTTTYWLSVKYTNCYLGCGGQDSIAIKVLPSFVVNGPVEACVEADGTFSAIITSGNLPIDCNWTMTGPTGNPVWSSAAAQSSITPPFSDGIGIYRVFATADDPSQTCSDQQNWAISVRPRPAKPLGILGERKICPGTAYTYEVDGGTPQTNYLWTWQNGVAGPFFLTGKTVNVNWQNSGPRWLSVSEVSADGLSCLSDTVLLTVVPIGIPDITGTPGLCEDTRGNYVVAPLQNIDFQWSVSPVTAGSVAAGQSTDAVEIYWSQAGNHTVNLNVCGQTASFPVTVFAPPNTAVLSPAGLCPGATALVQTVATFPGYTWKDDAGALLSNAATLQLGPGNYAVEITDVNGCRSTEEFMIDSWETPDVSLTTASPTGFCNNSIFVPLTALTNADADYTFQWFQDGLLLAGQTASTYSTDQYGSYTVQATNAQGCTNVAGPIVLFLYCGGDGHCTGQQCSGDLCPPGTVSIGIDPTARCDSFQMHLLDPSGVYQPGTASWVVGISGGVELGSSTDTDPSFTFGNAGEYVAVLTVTLTDGNACHVFDFFGAEAVARIDVTPGCPGEATQFQDISEFLPSGGISSWAWELGDPASGANNLSAIRDPAHTYDPSGTYTAMLTVTGTSGCTSSATAVVDIPLLPDVTFAEPAFVCAGNALSFAPPPNTADITDLSWDFGDPASGASNDAFGNPVYHNFSPAGTYTVTASATNVFGCTASFSRNIVVPPNTLSGTIPVPPAICEGGSITLTAPAGATSYLWSDANATTTPLLTVDKEGVFRVTMTDANGCTYAPPAVKVEVNSAPDALIKALLFNELGQLIGTSYPSLTVCEGEDVVLQAVSNTAANYSWSVSNGNNQILQFTDDRGNLLTPGTYTYSVTITNPFTGCTTVTTPFTVTVNPKPSGFSINGNNVCAGNPTALNYSGPQPANWQLIWNTGLSGPTLNTEEPGSYQIRVINEFGCEARSNVWTILPGPPVGAVPAGCHTRCNPDTLCLPSLPNVTSWQWFQNGSPIPGATSPNFIAQQSGTYWAQLTDNYGCTAESDPLNLNLYQGYGKILGQVWSDVNNNGVVDAGDTLVSGMPVILYQNSTLFDAANSGANGGFAFPNVLSTDYSVQLDLPSMPANWNIVIGQAPVSLVGCDVEESVDLLVHFACQAFGTLQLAACSGETVTYQGMAIAAGGSQIFNLTTAQGCDSTLVVSVQVLQPSTATTVLRACLGDSATYAGVKIPVGGFEYFTLTNAVGCDSILEVYVAPWLPSTGAATLHACPGGTVNYQGTDLAVGATQQFTLQNWHGCDSVVTVNVLPWPTSSGTATLSACKGDSATYNGVDILAGTTQQITLQNWHGCDSIVTVTVQELPTSTGSATFLFACSGGFATYNGTNIPAGTSQQFTLQTWLGCDSVVTVSVAALPPATGTATLYACPGGSAMYNGTSIPAGTSQNFALTNWVGCDSVVTVNVLPWPTSTGAANLFACPGGAATYAGTSVPVGTSQNFTLQNWLGCDSIVTVNVAPWPVTNGSTTLFACPGGAATYAGTSVPVGTSQNFTLQNWLGCDSTVTVTVNQLQSTTKLLEASVCPGTSYDFNGTAIASGESRDFHLLNAAGCDSTITVKVNEHPSATFAVQTKRTCVNAATGSIEALINPGGQPPFQYSLNNVDYQDTGLFENLGAGNYQLFLEDANGCVFEQPAVVPSIPALQVVLPNGILSCDSSAVTLMPEITGGDTAMTYKWWNGATGSSTQAAEAGPVWVEITDACSTERSEAVVELAPLAQDLSIVYVPNIFKPASSNPDNAAFKPLFASGINVLGFKFMVFDRWGNELFETKSFDASWDGVFQGEAMNPGVMVWYLEADVAVCGRVIHVVKKGDVTVYR